MSTFDDPNREAVGLPPIYEGTGDNIPDPPEGKGKGKGKGKAKDDTATEEPAED